MAWTAMFFLWKKYRICDTLKNGTWRCKQSNISRQSPSGYAGVSVWLVVRWNKREASRCGMNKHKGYKHKRYENKYTA